MESFRGEKGPVVPLWSMKPFRGDEGLWRPSDQWSHSEEMRACGIPLVCGVIQKR